MRAVKVKFFVSLAVLLLATLGNASEWDDAEQKISRLSPKEFQELPPVVMEELIRLGCTIPQIPFYTKEKRNVISGNFAVIGQKDYAALCSINGVSHIQIIWGGTARCESKLSPLDDKIYLQTVLEGVISYSREITRLSGKAIADNPSTDTESKPPSATHDGIADAFLEKASNIALCIGGTWHMLDGAD